MRSSVTALLTIVISIILLVGLFVAVDTTWSTGEDNVNSTGSYFANCIEGILDEENECEFFSNEQGNEGGIE